MVAKFVFDEMGRNELGCRNRRDGKTRFHRGYEFSQPCDIS